MIIPTRFHLKEHAHGHGDRLYWYEWEDTAGLGVMLNERSEGRIATRTWHLKDLPGMSFSRFEDLQAEAAKLTPEVIAAEAAMYPYIRTRERDTCGNACHLCPRPPYVPGPRVIHDTMRYAVATCWRPIHDVTLSLCRAHDSVYCNDPAGLLAALQAEVEARRQRVKDRGLNSLLAGGGQ